MTRLQKIRAAKADIAARLGDLIEKNFDFGGSALVIPGAFTVHLEAYRACEIAEAAEAAATKPAKNPMIERGMREL